MPTKGEPQTTESGKEVPSAPHRIRRAIRELTRGGYSHTRDVLVDVFGICPRTATSDIKEAYRLIAEDAEAERPSLRAREVERMTRVALKAEQEGEFSAAVAASARIAKLNGLDVDIVQVGGVTPEQQAMLSALVLTPYQRRQQIEEIRARIGTPDPTRTPPISDEESE